MKIIWHQKNTTKEKALKKKINKITQFTAKKQKQTTQIPLNAFQALLHAIILTQ